MNKKEQWQKNKLEEVQYVDVYVMISGDYCAFHEMYFEIVFDLTNKIQLDDYTEKELDDWEGEYSDVECRSAVLIKEEYYVDW